MPIARRIYVSMPADDSLTDQENKLKRAIVRKIEESGYIAEIFADPRGKESLAAQKGWSRADADHVARKCVGAAFLGFPRWRFNSDEGEVLVATEFSHYEGGIAYTLGLPMLVLANRDLMRRVVFDLTSGNFIGRFPGDAGPDWVETQEFSACFSSWTKELENRRDVFLGYCSSSVGTARNLRRFLEAELKVSVLDWKRDFRPGRTILQEIDEARQRCTAGIFLFTKDDDTALPDGNRTATPRDNVVFEAGYFASAKGSEQVLIVLEAGAKLPADLGGTIYAPLNDRADIQPLENPVKLFLEAL